MGRPLKLPRYVHAFIDRHGRPRFYLRRKGHCKVALPGMPWSPSFMEVYEKAMAITKPMVTKIGADAVELEDVITKAYRRLALR